MPSNARLAAQAVESFKTWAAERERAGDWADYLRAGKLNRSELAKECGFGRAALQQNPALAQALADVEARLAGQGIVQGSPVGAQDLPPGLRAEVGAAEERARRATSARDALLRRIKALEERNAVLLAANRELTERLRRSVLAEHHLAETGRMLPP